MKRLKKPRAPVAPGSTMTQMLEQVLSQQSSIILAHVRDARGAGGCPIFGQSCFNLYGADSFRKLFRDKGVPMDAEVISFQHFDRNSLPLFCNSSEYFAMTVWVIARTVDGKKVLEDYRLYVRYGKRHEFRRGREMPEYQGFSLELALMNSELDDRDLVTAREARIAARRARRHSPPKQVFAMSEAALQ